jgi:hypothetical protein
MLPFWISIAALSVAQGVLVALPRGLQQSRLARLRGRRWGLVPPLSVLGFVAIARGAERASANGLTYLALVAVPLLAALALGWLGTAARPRHALLAGVLFAVAWIDRGGLAGEACALALSALSCVALGALIGVVTPPRWLAGGIVAMALADAWLVTAELLQRPNSALNAAHPAAGLPRLQSAVLGHAVMGYGDLFIAGALGGLLAISAPRAVQRRAAVLTAALALAFDLLFFAVEELPATVPVALAMLVALTMQRRSARRERSDSGRVRSRDAAAAPARRAPLVR